MGSNSHYGFISGCLLGFILGAPASILDAFGVVFESFWATFLVLGRVSGATWAPTRFMDPFLHSFGGLLGSIWEPLGAPWGPFGVPWGGIGAPRGRFGHLFVDIFYKLFRYTFLKEFGARFLRFFFIDVGIVFYIFSGTLWGGPR